MCANPIKENMWDLLYEKQQDAKTYDSVIYKQNDPFYAQKMTVRTDISSYSRHDFFANLCENKRVLHVGCTDYPFTGINGHLHLHIDKYAKTLDGFDIDEPGLRKLQQHVKGKMISKWENVVDEYDLVLAPEVIEHVDNVGEFIQNINKVNCKHLVVTAPDAYSCYRNNHFEYSENNKTFVEIVHKDHNCWYSPFTIKNVIEKHSDYKVNSSWFFYGRSILIFATKN